jgi:hypothetical protein
MQSFKAEHAPGVGQWGVVQGEGCSEHLSMLAYVRFFFLYHMALLQPLYASVNQIGGIKKLISGVCVQIRTLTPNLGFI